jgi:hypothetical protein
MLLPTLELLPDAATTSVAGLVVCLAVTAFRKAVSILLLGAFSVQWPPPTPEASRGLLAVDPDVAKALAVVTPRESSLSAEVFNLYIYVAEVCEGEYGL